MGDTVLTALAEATTVLHRRVLGPGSIKRVRVPGKNIGACKTSGTDNEPCILVEEFDRLGRVMGRYLCWEVQFLGLTRMVQSIETPCAHTGAILWLETSAAVVCEPKQDLPTTVVG